MPHPAPTASAKSDAQFAEKHETEKYACSKGFESFTAVRAGWYLENFLDEHFARFLGGFPFTADEEGYLTFTTPRWEVARKFPLSALRMTSVMWFTASF